MTFKPTPSQRLNSELMKDPRYRAFIIETAEKLAEETRQAMHPFSKTEDFEKSIQASEGKVGANPLWAIVEFGSKNNPPYSPFRRAVRASGLKFRDQK